MKRFISYALIGFTLFTIGCNTTYRQANKHYRNFQYNDAAIKYKEYLKDHTKPLAIKRIAKSYYEMHDWPNSEYYYAKVVAMPRVAPKHKFNYATALKANGWCSEAKYWYIEYLKHNPDDKVAQGLMASCDSMLHFHEGEHRIEVMPLSVNQGNANFAMARYEKGYVFSSERALDSNVKIDPWDGHPYLELLYADVLPNGDLANARPFNKNLSIDYHDGPATFNATYDKIYFSRSNYLNDRLHKSLTNVNHIQLYTASKNDKGEWVDIQQLPFNSHQYSTGHPTLSADGKTLYFVSDRPGAYGKTDIFSSDFVDGKWTKPKNLGTMINTEGYEMFPYFYKAPNGKEYLYYSTDGLSGMGGLDIYYSQKLDDGSWSVPTHIHAPINSAKDDFAIIINDDQESGYFSSSRGTDGTEDKLFLYKKYYPQFFVEGRVYNKANKKPVSLARIDMTNTTRGIQNILSTDENGYFWSKLDSSSVYEFIASKEKYKSGSTSARTVGLIKSDTLEVVIYLTPYEIPEFVNIYYDFDKWNIRADAAETLDELAETLKQYPYIYLDLSSHADARGSDEYNMKLSEKRARSVIDYLIGKGIDKERLAPGWYGERQPLNECVDDIICTPPKHQQNRRTQFKVRILETDN